MASFDNIMLLSGRTNSALIEDFFEMGITPIVKERMDKALDKLRHNPFDIIFIDRDSVPVDALEFILNVRDLGLKVPIIVLGNPVTDYKDQVLERQANVFIINIPRTKFKRKIGDILSDSI